MSMTVSVLVVVTFRLDVRLSQATLLSSYSTSEHEFIGVKAGARVAASRRHSAMYRHDVNTAAHAGTA